MASNITERARSYFGYAAPQYDFERTLQWTYGDKYYLQASQKGFQDTFDTRTKQQRGPVVELSSQKLMEIAKQALKNGEIIIAEKSLGNAIRKEKLENISSERNPESYYYLAEVLQTKAAKGDLELLQRQRFLLQAASLYNFVRNCWGKSTIQSDFSKNMPNTVSRRLLDIQDSLVLSAGGNPLCCKFDSESKKNVLENLRKEAKCCLESINGTYDEHEAGSEEGLRNIFVKQQTVEIRGLFKKIASVVKQLLAGIIQECLEVLGKPPCNYEVVVLGSLAREEMTPYSDLEWAIITSSEEEQCKVYFRNLTNLVHLQIINLGETILPNMDIEALRCEWFYDDVTPRGVSFDGLLPQASKTPLGNTTDFELIHNPAKMADFQSNYWYKKNPGLGEILLTVAPLEDNKHLLVDEYRIEVERILSSPCDLDGCVHGVSSDKQPNQGTCRGLVTLKQDVSRYGEMILGSDQMNDGKLYDVKKEIYRLTDRVVAGLAKFFCVEGNGAFEVLDKLCDRGVIGSSGRDNLASAVAIALKLRLSTYLEAGKQQEEIKAKPDEAVVNSDSAHTYAYHMPREKELFHFFYVAIPLYEKLYRFFPNDENLSDTFSYDIFFDCSDAVKGHIYCRVLNYTEARNSYERALEVDPGNIDLELRQIRIEFINEQSQDVAVVKQKLNALLLEMRKRYNLPELTMTTESGEVAVAEFDSCCDLIKCELQTPIDGSQLLEILYFTALFHQVQGNFETARAILYQCLEMDKKRLSFDYLQKLMITLSLLELTLISGLQLKQEESDVITSQLSALIEDEGISVRGFILLNRLGELLVNQDKNDEAYLCLQRALTMGRTLFGSNLNFNVVITLHLLGTVSTRLLMYEESKFYFGQLIKLLPSLAGLAPLLITKSVHHSMAIIFANTNDHKEAVSHLQKGLELPSNGTGTELTLDCVMYCNMATSWNKLGAHEKAWQSASDAEKCLRSVENEKIRVALTCFVFQTYMEVGKNEDVILQLERRLQELHSQPDSEVKAQYLNSLGELSAQRGLTEDAERYYKKALEFLRIKNSNTFGIVENLLGISNILLGNKKSLEAISYVDEAWKYALTAVDNDQKCMYLTKIAECWEKLGESYRARRCYEQALKICTKSVLTPKVPLKEFDLHVKLGDLVENNNSSVSNTVGMSTEQLMNVKRMHYDQAGNVLRRHSASGNFHSTTVLLFMHLASKYGCIDLWEREKLLLEALKMSEEIYESDQVSETVANVLSSLSDVYFERKDHATAIEFLDRSLKMEMELHSSDPYHPHITQQISDISSLYLGCPGSKKLEDAVQSLLTFLESHKEEEMSINDAAKANYFVTMANFMVVCLDDFARAETLNQMASDIFTTIQKTSAPVDVPLYTSLCDTMKRILEIWKANPGVQPLVKMALSSGLLSSLFDVSTTNEASSSLIGEIGIGNLLGMCTDENNPSRINTEEKPPDVPVCTSGIVSTMSPTDPITGNDDMMSTFSKAVSGDSKFYEKSTFASEGSNTSAEERVSPPTHTAQTIKTVTAGIEDVNVTIDQIKPTLIKLPEVPQENSDRAIGNVAFQELPVESASTLQCDIDRHMISDSPEFLLAGTSTEQEKQNEVSFKHEKEKNGAISVGSLGYPTFGGNLEPANDTEEWLQNKAQDPETLQTKMDSLTCVADSIIYDLNQKNLEDAGKNIEEGFLPLMMSFLDKFSSASFVPSGAQFSIDEAVKARDNNDITLMPQYLQLAEKYPLNPKRKAMCSKLWGEFHLHQENYRMAAISFSEAIACYRSFSTASEFDHQIEYAGSLIGLTKSYMLCNDLQSAWSACQEGIAVVSTGELESTARLLVQLFYLAAKCTIQLSEHSTAQDRDLEPAVSFCHQALATTEVVDQFHGSSDLTDELSGLEKGEFFALKCEIKLLLAKTLCRLKKSDEARKIMREMNEFLGNIVVVLETYSSDTWPGGEVEFYKIQRPFFSWVGQTLVMSGDANVAVNPLMRSLTLFFAHSVPVTIFPPEELLALLDAMTATKEATTHQEYNPFRETLELCKHQYLKQRDDLKELQEFFGNLGNHYVDCGRTEEAIVSYETGLTVAECIEHSDANNTRGQMLLYLANAHRLQAIKNTGKGAVEENRLAESYYKTGRETRDFSIYMYADFLCDEGRFNEAVSVLVNLTKAGNRLWDKYCITSYSKRALFGRGVQKYMESHGKLVTPIGNLAYSGLVRAYVGMGTKKEAVAAYEKLSSSGKDLRHTPFGNRPPLLPYLLSSCQKGLLSLVEDQSYLQFNDSDFPLSEGNLAKVFYELGEYELTLSCCQKARTLTEPSQSKDTEAMDLFQSELSSLRLTGNALVMLGRENESYSYFFSFLKSLQRQEKILDKPFHEAKVFLGQYSFARLYYIYRSLGLLLAGQGNIDSAIECCKYCLELDPDYNCDQNIVGTLAELYQTKAFSASEDKATYRKWMDTAQECFDGVISRNIKLTPFVEAAFASFLSRTERPKDSIVHFEQLLDGADSVISFSVLDKPLVGAYLEREIQARGQLELPLKIDVYNQLAMAYLKCNELENAQESARRMEEYAAGFESSPHYPVVLSVLGYTYKEIGNERKAVKIFNAVLKMCPDHVPVKLALANCRTGEKEEQSSDQTL